MPDKESTKAYHGYVSAYLNQVPRTLEEAKKDVQGQARRTAANASQPAQVPQSNPGADRRAARQE